MKLSIIIPAHNEAERIRPMLETYFAFFEERYGAGLEIIVVVNGCQDGTESVVRSYEGGHPSLRVLAEPGRIGKGGAVMMGLEAASGEFVGYVDADGSTPPHAFDDLVQKIGPAGAIIASRWLPGARVNPPQPLRRRIASRAFNSLVRLYFSLPITDTQCGAKVLRREAARAILPRLGVTRWAFDVDLLFQLRRAGFAITEIPTEWQDVAGSQLRIPKASFEMFLAITRLRLLHSPFRGIVHAYNRTLARRFPTRVR